MHEMSCLHHMQTCVAVPGSHACSRATLQCDCVVQNGLTVVCMVLSACCVIVLCIDMQLSGAAFSLSCDGIAEYHFSRSSQASHSLGSLVQISTKNLRTVAGTFALVSAQQCALQHRALQARRHWLLYLGW